MTTPMEARTRLNELANELGRLSSLLAKCEADLEPVEERYRKFMDAFDVGLWVKHTNGEKLPSAAMREKLAHQEIDAELLGQWIGLTNMRRRLVQRMRALGKEIEAQRSILSALKAELEAGA